MCWCNAGQDRQRNGTCLAGLALHSHRRDGPRGQHLYSFRRCTAAKSSKSADSLADCGFGDGDMVLLGQDGVPLYSNFHLAAPQCCLICKDSFTLKQCQHAVCVADCMLACWTKALHSGAFRRQSKSIETGNQHITLCPWALPLHPHHPSPLKDVS